VTKASRSTAGKSANDPMRRKLGYSRYRAPARSLDRASRLFSGAKPAVPGLVRISAGNYGSRLGKNFVYLRPERQPPA